MVVIHVVCVFHARDCGSQGTTLGPHPYLLPLLRLGLFATALVRLAGL